MDVMRIGSGDASQAENVFRQRLIEMRAPRVLELGTLRWESDRPTHHKEWAPHASEYVMTDVAPGTDVDIVAEGLIKTEFKHRLLHSTLNTLGIA
jgi:hypothetical protein